VPVGLPAVIADQARRIGAHDVVLYLIDYEQRTLVSLSRPQRADLASLSVAGTIAGRALSTASILRSTLETITDRTVMLCKRYAHLTAMLIATKQHTGDTFKVTRRQQPMTIAGELASKRKRNLTYRQILPARAKQQHGSAAPAFPPSQFPDKLETTLRPRGASTAASTLGESLDRFFISTNA
jgi:hypothetical protein